MRRIIIFYITISLSIPIFISHAAEVKKEIKNKDGKVNTWVYYENNKPVRIESDRNYDGKIDLWIAYGKNGKKVTQIDLNFDGRQDMYSYYRYGQRTRLEIDINYDGKIDQINEYKDGRVVKMQKDTNKDGKLETVFDITGRFLSHQKNAKDDKNHPEPLSKGKTLPKKQKAQ